MRVVRGRNINFKFSWEYPVSRSATVSFATVDQLVDFEDANINRKCNGFFRESRTSNGWARLRGSRLESICSRKGECCSVRAPLDHLRARRNKRWQAHLFFIERQMHKGVGCPSS